MIILLNAAVQVLTGTLVGALHGAPGFGAVAGLCCFGADMTFWAIAMRTEDHV